MLPATAPAAAPDPDPDPDVIPTTDPGAETPSTAPTETPTTDPTAAATTDQSADSAATATQQQPINMVVIVRVDSPGQNGPVTQNNIAVAPSTAANDASTGQDGGDDAASTSQQSTATATATQDAAGNLVISVRIDSPGANGGVSQTNGAAGASTGSNTSDTTQQVAAPTPAVQPQAHRVGAASSRKPIPRHPRLTAAVRAPVESGPQQAVAPELEQTAVTPHRAAMRRGTHHRRAAAARESSGPTHQKSTLSGVAGSAIQAFSSFVPHVPSTAKAAQSGDISRPVLLTLLFLATAVLGAFALVRRVPLRRRAASGRASR